MTTVSRNTDRALFVLRLAVACVFIAHGHAKFFAMGHDGVTGFFTRLHVPLPGIAAWGVMVLEFIGGFALLTGAFTRALAVLFAIDMVAAIALAVFPRGFLGGYELEFLLCAGSVALALGGGGAPSVDRWLASRRRA